MLFGVINLLFIIKCMKAFKLSSKPIKPSKINIKDIKKNQNAKKIKDIYTFIF